MPQSRTACINVRYGSLADISEAIRNVRYIAFALYLLANFSTVSDWMLGVLLGVLLVVEGTALSSLAWRVRQEI